MREGNEMRERGEREDERAGGDLRAGGGVRVDGAGVGDVVTLKEGWAYYNTETFQTKIGDGTEQGTVVKGHEHPGTLIVQLDDGQLVSAAIAGMTVTQGIHLDSGPTDSRPLCGASNQAETTSDINFVTCDECYELHERRIGGDGMIEGTI